METQSFREAGRLSHRRAANWKFVTSLDGNIASFRPGLGSAECRIAAPRQVSDHHDVQPAGDHLAHVVLAGRQGIAVVVPDLRLRPQMGLPTL